MNHNRRARVVMVQGTSSHAGKSLLATALCRIFRQDGFRTAPFKAQNMSLNSCPTPDGLEIGRSQATQAAAAGVPARVEMNPVLLKPETEGRTQVVVMGRPVSTVATDSRQPRGPQLWDVVVRALDRLRREFDIVVIEGAGSPVEINIKERDIANMRVACHADAPVLLVGDIDLGGVLHRWSVRWRCLNPPNADWSKVWWSTPSAPGRVARYTSWTAGWMKTVSRWAPIWALSRSRLPLLFTGRRGSPAGSPLAVQQPLCHGPKRAPTEGPPAPGC